MKKLFLLLMLVFGFVAFSPTAEAGQYAKVYTKYGPTYVHKSALYGSNNYYHGSRHRTSYRSYRQRYYEPVRYSRRGYYRDYDRGYYRNYDSGYYRSYDDGCYRTPVRYYGSRHHYSSRPRIAISFGF